MQVKRVEMHCITRKYFSKLNFLEVFMKTTNFYFLGFFVSCIILAFTPLSHAESFSALVQSYSDLQTINDDAMNNMNSLCSRKGDLEQIRDTSIDYVIAFYQDVQARQTCDYEGVAADNFSWSWCNLSLAILKKSNQLLETVDSICYQNVRPEYYN